MGLSTALGTFLTVAKPWRYLFVRGKYNEVIR